jgi:hypothetical protein
MILGGSQIIDCLFLLLAVSREHRNLNRLPATLCSIVGAYHRVEPIALLVHGSPLSRQSGSLHALDAYTLGTAEIWGSELFSCFEPDKTVLGGVLALQFWFIPHSGRSRFQPQRHTVADLEQFAGFRKSQEPEHSERSHPSADYYFHYD